MALIVLLLSAAHVDAHFDLHAGTLIPRGIPTAAALTSQTITFAALAGKTYGVAPFTVSATASSALPVSFASLTTAVCTVSGATVTVVAAGTCTIQASQAGNATFAAAPNVSQGFAVAKATQSITFGLLSARVYGAAPFAVSATASSGLAVTFASTTTAVCTVSTATVTIVAAGLCTIQASQAGNGNYNAATAVNQSLTVAKATQSITFGALAVKVYGAAPFGVSATATSGLPVSFASTTTGVCTVSASTVTVVTAGTCTIQASQAGNGNYSAATVVNQSFTVAKATQTITFGALAAKAYGAAPFAVSATASSGLAVSFASTTTAVCTMSASTVTIVAAGTCTIQASQAGNGNYSAATVVNQSFTVAKASQTITFGVLASRVYGAAPFAVSATASSGLTVSFASTTTGVCTVSAGTVTMIAPGTCTIQASQAGNTNYAAAPTVSQSFTVAKVSQTITFGALTAKVYGAAPFTVSATASSGLAVSFASTTTLVCTVSVSTVTIVAAGTCTIRASQAGNATYAAAANVDQSFTVTAAAPPITFAPAVNYATGSYPESIALGDFNGDGIPDLAVANAFSGNVSIFIGHSDGTFTLDTSVASGGTPEVVAVGDFNGDGKLDLAICDFTGGNVIIFAGNGDGTFHLVGSFMSGLYPVAIAVADLDHDGNLDLVIANTTSGSTTGQTVSVLMGNGDGSFRAPVPYITGTSPYGVVVGDFNGDGKLDLAVANFGDNTVSVLKGNGDGTFAAAVPYATGYFPDGLAIGDFNGDGKLDLAVVSDNANVSILLGYGDGTFGAATNFTTGSGSASVAVVDLNGDGRLDLAIVNRFDNNLVLLIGNGDGTFQAPQIYSVGASPSVVVARDLNGDGKPDLVVNSHVNNNISVWLQTGAVPATLSIQSGSPQSAAAGSAFATPLAVLVRDAASNPLLGVSITFTAPTTGASGVFSGSGAVAQAASNASGVATAPPFTANATTGSFSVIASVATLNATFALTNTTASPGPPAFTSAPPPNGTVNASYNFTVTASGTPAPTFSVLSNTLPTGLSLNGTSGLIAGTPSAQGTFAGMLTASNGVPPAATQTFAITIASLAQTITFGSLSSKPLGSAPFAVSATASSGLPVSFLSQTTAVCTVAGSQVTLAATGTCTIRTVQAGNATYGPAANVDQSFQVTTPNQPPTVTLKTPANNSAYVAPAIVPLYAIASDPDGTISKVEFYNGVLLLGAATTAPYTYSWTAVGAGSYPITAKAYDNQGATTVSAVANITVSAAGQHVSFIHSADLSGVLSALEGGMVLGDFNGDAKLDVILTDGQCERALLQGDGTGGFVLHQGVILTSGGCGAMIAADFNGDGKLDLAIQTVLNQSYYVSVNLGHGDGTLSAGNVYLLPTSASHIISGDFNGDGKLDLAAALNNGAVALLLGNGDGTFQAPRVIPAGNAFLQGIAAGDINGDGKLDLVVSDPSNRSLDVLLGNGDGTFQAPKTIVTGAFPAYPQEIALGDFSGDGKLDIAVTELFSATVSVLLGNGDGTFQPAFDYPAGNATGGIVAAEFNGDGRLDLAVANSADNTVSILAGNGNGSFQAPVTVATGGYPRQIIAGDLNGDGLLDMVVSNSSSTTSLSVLINTNGRTPTAPIFTSGPAPDGTANTAYRYPFTASAFPAPHFTMSSASLPLNVLSPGGILSGPFGPGLYTGVVTASNGVQPDATQAFSFVVHPNNQTINFPPIADVPLNLSCVFTAFLGQCENDFAASASSGLPVTFLSLTSDTCTLTYVPNVTWYFTTIAAGTCIIRAEQQGGASFAAAPPVERNFQITAVSAASAANVVITSPGDHQDFVAPGSITITATASYLTGYGSAPGSPTPLSTDPLFVEFYFDGLPIGVVATNPPTNAGSASVTKSGVSIGTHVISAQLREYTPGLPTSDTYYVADATPITVVVTAVPDTPTISLTGPANGSSYTAPGMVVLAATATNSSGTIAKVDFYDGPFAVGTSTSAPYTFTWTNVRAGTHVVSAKATSGNGVVAASAAVSISVGSGIDSLVALYSFDDNWSSLKPVQEPIGNSYGEVQGAATAIAAPAVAQKPDTCRAASFGGGTIDAFALPVPTSSGGVTTLAFWMNWNGTDGAMPLSWTTEGLVFSGGSFGFTTTGSDVYGIASTSFANTWHHVVAEFHNGSVTANRLVIDGVAQSLSQRAGAPTLANATASNNLRFGGQSGSSSHRFAGALDDVQVFDGTVTDAHVAELFTAANPCAVVAVRLLAPSQNASYNAPGTIEFLGVATTTNTRINHVDLYDGPTLVTTQAFGFNTATFRYTAAGIAAGTHAYTLRATDSAAQTATSSPPVTATVYQATGTSTVALTVPGTSTTLYTSDPIHLAVAVRPGTSYGIYLVQFFGNGQLIGQRFSAPYLFTWKFPSAGTYSIVAEVVDTSGHAVFSTPITITVLQGEPQLVYFYNDAAGTPLAATDQNGTLLWMETYAPYGARYTNDDTSTKNGLWYTGKPTEDVTGLAYYGGRWYSPSIGRFYSVDPQVFRENSAISFNRYAYANNNPYRFIDPNGLDSQPTNGCDESCEYQNSNQRIINITDTFKELSSNVGESIWGLYQDYVIGKGIGALAAGIGVIKVPALIRNAHLAGKTHPTTEIPFTDKGFPDFSGVAVRTVRIKQTGNRAQDYAAANRAAGLGDTPRGYTWHHHEDMETMQLVPSDIHRATGHSGGVSQLNSEQ